MRLRATYKARQSDYVQRIKQGTDIMCKV